MGITPAMGIMPAMGRETDGLLLDSGRWEDGLPLSPAVMAAGKPVVRPAPQVQHSEQGLWPVFRLETIVFDYDPGSFGVLLRALPFFVFLWE